VQFEAAAVNAQVAFASAGDFMQLIVGRGHHAIAATTLCQIQRLISLSECILKL
jgi:hypothetical protein